MCDTFKEPILKAKTNIKVGSLEAYLLNFNERKFALDEARRRYNDMRATLWCGGVTTEIMVSHSISFHLTQNFNSFIT